MVFDWKSRLGTHVTRAGLGYCGNTSHPIAGQQMARLALALVCFVGAAHGFGGDDGDQQAKSLDSLAAPLRPTRR